MQDGSLHANSYNIGGLMKAYVETNGNAAFMYDMPQANGSVNTAEQYVEKLAGLNQNAKASAEVADTISSFVTAMQDMGDAIPAEVHDTVMAAYRTFEASGTNSNAFTVMQTALQSIDSAIGTQLVSGGDVTGLLALRSRMESGLGGTVRAKSAVNAKAMADAVDMLMRLPADVQAAIDVDALSKAYFDYLTAGKADKAAAQGKAVDLLFDSAQAAIATGKLDAAAMQKLEGLMAEIDSKRGVGDNGKKRIGRVYKTTTELLKESTCSVNDLYRYLKNIDSNAAEEFLNNRHWPDGVQIPKSPNVLKPDGSIDWDKVPKGGYVLDSNGDAIKDSFIPAVGEIIDRFGSSNGRYTSPVVDGKPYAYDQRALPYVENPAQYHQYEVIGDFTNIRRYIEEIGDTRLKTKIRAYIDRHYNGDYSMVKVYKGKVAKAFDATGGAIQFEFPLRMEWLVSLGLIREI